MSIETLPQYKEMRMQEEEEKKINGTPKKNLYEDCENQVILVKAFEYAQNYVVLKRHIAWRHFHIKQTLMQKKINHEKIFILTHENKS